MRELLTPSLQADTQNNLVRIDVGNLAEKRPERYQEHEERAKHTKKKRA